ncbi:MAG: hypothetical protein QXO20_07655 [Candidatus Bathyarchaeia archaeon]
MVEKLKRVWERDKEMIIAGGIALLGPELLRGRGRPSKIMSLIQLAGFGILVWVGWKNKDLFFGS